MNEPSKDSSARLTIWPVPPGTRISSAERKDMQVFRRAYRKARKNFHSLQRQIAEMESIARTTRLSPRHHQRSLSHLRCLTETAFGMLLDAEP